MELFDLMTNHRSIRKFTSEPVPKETIQRLLDGINQTPSSTGMQRYSVIRVTDPSLLQELSKVCLQDYVADLPELFIFIVDCYRNREITLAKGGDPRAAGNMDRFFQGFTDGCLAAQNLTILAESMGLGCCYFGSLLNDSEKVIELLHLPELTFPIVGVGLGFPDQAPGLKPRMPMEYKVFENRYRVLPDYVKAMEEYDKVMETYYDLRQANRRVDSFTNQVVALTESVSPKRAEMLNVVKKQGFDLEVDYDPT